MSPVRADIKAVTVAINYIVGNLQIKEQVILRDPSDRYHALWQSKFKQLTLLKKSLKDVTHCRSNLTASLNSQKEKIDSLTSLLETVTIIIYIFLTFSHHPLCCIFQEFSEEQTNEQKNDLKNMMKAVADAEKVSQVLLKEYCGSNFIRNNT